MSLFIYFIYLYLLFSVLSYLVTLIYIFFHLICIYRNTFLSLVKITYVRRFFFCFHVGKPNNGNFFIPKTKQIAITLACSRTNFPNKDYNIGDCGLIKKKMFPSLQGINVFFKMYSCIIKAAFIYLK